MEPFTLNNDGTPTAPRPRPDWVKSRIAHFDRKCDPRLRKNKWALMAQSPFHFYRGTNHLFWADFGSSPLLEGFSGKKKTRLWICGDAHFENFGSFTDAAGRLVFDLNDFDQSVLADYQFDLWRLGASLVLASRGNKQNAKAGRHLALECARAYWREIKNCRWYENVRHIPWDEEQASGSLRHFLIHVRKTKGFPLMLDHWTKVDRSDLRLKVAGNKNLEALSPESRQKLEKKLQDYAKELKPWPGGKPRIFELLDAARRLFAGVGSEGLNRFYALARIKDEGEDPYRILEVKQVVKPGPWEYLPKKSLRKMSDLSGDSQVLRAELGLRALMRNADPWLGRMEFKGGEYMVREKSPFKEPLPLDKLDEDAASQLGSILARAHCRSKVSFAKSAYEIIKPDKKAFRKQAAEIALAYADQVEMDYQAFRTGGFPKGA